jgi:hypothetical protein
MGIWIRAAILAAAMVGGLWGAQGRAAELTFFERGKVPALLEFSAGGFAVPDNNGRDTTGIFQFDGISRWTIVNFWDRFQVNPYLGGFVTAKGGKMGYVGIHGTIPVVQHFELSPFFAIGAYGKGNGRDLGSTALFQTGLQAMYVFDSGYRAGLTFSHESNGTTLPRNHGGCTCNPGANNFLVTVAVPFTALMSLGD